MGGIQIGINKSQLFLAHAIPSMYMTICFCSSFYLFILPLVSVCKCYTVSLSFLFFPSFFNFFLQDTNNTPQDAHDLVMEFSPFCGICFESLLPSVGGLESTALVECGHRFCDECWKQHLRSRVNQGDTNLTCPVSVWINPAIMCLNVINFKIFESRIIKVRWCLWGDIGRQKLTLFQIECWSLSIEIQWPKYAPKQDKINHYGITYYGIISYIRNPQFLQLL